MAWRIYKDNLMDFSYKMRPRKTGESELFVVGQSKESSGDSLVTFEGKKPAAIVTSSPYR